MNAIPSPTRKRIPYGMMIFADICRHPGCYVDKPRHGTRMRHCVEV